MNEEGAVEFINRAGLRVLGYDDQGELLGRPSHRTIHAHHRDGPRIRRTGARCARGKQASPCKSTTTGSCAELREIGVPFDRIVESEVTEDGLASFSKPFDSLIETVGDQLRQTATRA